MALTQKDDTVDDDEEAVCKRRKKEKRKASEEAAQAAESEAADLDAKAARKKKRKEEHQIAAEAAELAEATMHEAASKKRRRDKKQVKEEAEWQELEAELEAANLAKPSSAKKEKKKKQAEISLDKVSDVAQDAEIADSIKKSKHETTVMSPTKVVVLKYGWDWFERMKAEFKTLSVRRSADVIEVLGSNKVRKTFSLAFTNGAPHFIGEHPTKKSFPLTIQCRDSKDTCQEPVRLPNGDLSLQCIDCDNNFVFPKDEQVVFSNLGFESQPPKRCVDCRRAKKERNQRIAAKDARKGGGKIGKAGKDQSKGKGCGKDYKRKADKGRGKAKDGGAKGRGWI